MPLYGRVRRGDSIVTQNSRVRQADDDVALIYLWREENAIFVLCGVRPFCARPFQLYRPAT